MQLWNFYRKRGRVVRVRVETGLFFVGDMRIRKPEFVSIFSILQLGSGLGLELGSGLGLGYLRPEGYSTEHCDEAKEVLSAPSWRLFR